jgi:hypothetical protein
MGGKASGVIWNDYFDQVREVYSGYSPRTAYVGWFLDVELPSHKKGHNKRGGGNTTQMHQHGQSQDWSMYVEKVKSAFKAKYKVVGDAKFMFNHIGGPADVG